jgi:hypothetical protein
MRSGGSAGLKHSAATPRAAVRCSATPRRVDPKAAASKFLRAGTAAVAASIVLAGVNRCGI